MNYGRILSYVAGTPWAIDPTKMQDILAVLAHRAAGHTFSAEEIQAQIGEQQPMEQARSGNVAIVPLRGVIAHRMGGMQESSGGMSTERFIGMMRQADADASVGTIVIDADTPGGTVSGVSEAADVVFEMRARKRIITVAKGRLASAGYWIGSQAHKIYAVPSLFDPIIGSIGVFAVFQDLTEHLAKEGIKFEMIKAGKNKADIMPFLPMTDEQKARVKANVDAAYAQFTKDVARGLGVSVADVRNGYGEGLAFSAQEAKKIGLVHELATMEDVIGRELGGGRRSTSRMRADGEIEPLVAETPAGDSATPSTVDADRARRMQLL